LFCSTFFFWFALKLTDGPEKGCGCVLKTLGVAGNQTSHLCPVTSVTLPTAKHCEETPTKFVVVNAATQGSSIAAAINRKFRCHDFLHGVAI